MAPHAKRSSRLRFDLPGHVGHNAHSEELEQLDGQLGNEARLTPPGNSRSAKTREALRTAFLRLLEQKPLEQVTVREVAAGAAVNYSTFFRHYPDKETLLNDVAEEQIRQLLAMTLPLLFSVDSRASSRALCAFVWEHRKLWTVLLTGGASSSLKKEFIRQARELAAKAGHEGAVIPSDLRVVFCVSGTLEILAWWLEHGEGISIDQMAEIQDMLAVAPHVPTNPEAFLAPSTTRAPRTGKQGVKRPAPKGD
jgi:AcrR family transcriptional regulator